MRRGDRVRENTAENQRNKTFIFFRPATVESTNKYLHTVCPLVAVWQNRCNTDLQLFRF